MEVQINYDKQKVMEVCNKCRINELYQIPTDNSELVIFVVPLRRAECNRRMVESMMQDAVAPLSCCTSFTELNVADKYRVVYDGNWIV